MKTVYISLFAGAFIIATAFLSCKQDKKELTPTSTYLDLPSTPYNYNSSEANEVTTLGRVLFYDTHLSVNNAISCGSCHKQSLAFSDNVAFSRGFENHLTTRNALPIQNLNDRSFCTTCGFGASPRLFWDGRESFLNTMVLKPIINHVEMGMGNIDAIVDKVKDLPYYQDLFTNAYGTPEINANSIGRALASFTGSITSSNTRFDLATQGMTQLSTLEQQGKNLFFSKYDCNSCHQTEVLNGYEQGGGFVNIGLDMTYEDNGVGALKQDVNENGNFKIPNLRNVALTAPYMHDGRFTTLDEVVEHYSTGITDHPNLDTRLKESGHAKKMNITKQEKEALIAFLNTLTDYTMITDPKFASPFKSK